MFTKTDRKIRHVHFEVTTSAPLPVGEQVFVVGRQEALGSWSPDGFPLTRVDENLWTGAVMLPEDEPVEYKITRGTWDTEELTAEGRVAANKMLEPGGDVTVRVRVEDWRDGVGGSQPRITGAYRIHEGFHSEHLRHDRRVIVWLPPSYDREVHARFPVLYMQDGQQVFDPRTSTHNQDWQVDESCTTLMAEGKMREIIVVAVYCTDERDEEYRPGRGADRYARLVVEELKPYIDRVYKTKTDRASTAIAGSSLGGTVAFHLMWTRPDVFCGCAALSPVFIDGEETYCIDLVQASDAGPDKKIYLYCGSGDERERALQGGVKRMAEVLRGKGCVAGEDVVLREDEGGVHNESAWAGHTEEWLQFLFPR